MVETQPICNARWYKCCCCCCCCCCWSSWSCCCCCSIAAESTAAVLLEKKKQVSSSPHGDRRNMVVVADGVLLLLLLMWLWLLLFSGGVKFCVHNKKIGPSTSRGVVIQSRPSPAVSHFPCPLRPNENGVSFLIVCRATTTTAPRYTASDGRESKKPPFLLLTSSATS
jgi:hypothetical protein